MKHFAVSEHTWGRGRGVLVFYIRKERKELRYGVKSFFLPEIENIFFEILLTNTKPLVARTIYRQPSQSDFLKAVSTHVLGDFNNLLGNFNINLYLDNSHIFQKNNLLQSQSIPSDIKK